MTSVLGHLMSSDIVDHKRWADCAPELLFDAAIAKQVTPDHKPVKLNLEYEARGANMLVIWTDCDREGENIGAEIAGVCHAINPRIEIKRARFSVVQPREIHLAMQSLSTLDMRKSAAVDARIELDLRTGAALTRFLTLRFQSVSPDLQREVISYGSCQFPTLGFVVDQYKKVEAFIPEPFWKLEAAVERPDGIAKFQWDRGPLFDEESVRLLHGYCAGSMVARIVHLESRPLKKYKPYPLTTVEMQKMGTRILKITSDQIMLTAEKLYQQGLISYPRTETNEFEDSFHLLPLIANLSDHQTTGNSDSDGDGPWRREIASYAASLLLTRAPGSAAGELVPSAAFDKPRKGKKNDRAHPPIHPTKSAPPLMPVGERRVYEMITRRFLACCSRDAEGIKVGVRIVVPGRWAHAGAAPRASAATEKFHTEGLSVTARNYLAIYPYDRWAESEVPNFADGEVFTLSTCTVGEGATACPSLLSEADLIGLMDSNCIGTDATIHEHIKKIVDRKYVFVSDGGLFAPSTLGMALVEGVDVASTGCRFSLAKPALRAAMEHDLVAICDGRKTHADVVPVAVREFQCVYRQLVIRAQAIEDSLRAYLVDSSNPTSTVTTTTTNQNYRPIHAPAASSNNNASSGNHARYQQHQNKQQYNTPIDVARQTSSRAFGSGPRHPSADERPLPANRTEELKCLCNLVAAERTTTREGPNHGRVFLTCSKLNVASKCSFFTWVDQLTAEQARMRMRAHSNSHSPFEAGNRAAPQGTSSRGRGHGRSTGRGSRSAPTASGSVRSLAPGGTRWRGAGSASGSSSGSRAGRARGGRGRYASTRGRRGGQSASEVDQAESDMS